MTATLATPMTNAPTAAAARAGRLAALAIGCGMTLSLSGYHFGTGNHTVYLVDALHRLHPELLGNDWFTTGTLQYHAAFGWLTEILMRLHALGAGFLVGYLALVVLLNVATLRLVVRLGGDTTQFLLATIFFNLSAAGTGLGSYQFLQDGAFLPSNVAAVAMLWGLVCWLDRRWTAAGVWLGVAGLSHLNYAVVVPPLWAALLPFGRPKGRDAVVGTAVAAALTAVNVGFAIHAGLLGAGPTLPFHEFVDLYVRLRHPHHYDPSSWPVALWVSFLWPFPFAVVALRRNRDAMFLLAIFCVVLSFALVVAGVFYVSPAAVQLSLYRFSVVPKLVTCAGVALLFTPGRATTFFRVIVPAVVVAGIAARFVTLPPIAVAQLPAVGLFGCFVFLAAIRHGLVSGGRGQVATAAAAVLLVAVTWPPVGVRVAPDDDPAYVGLCRYAAAHTPTDAVFLVPPDEQEMRLTGRRAIVVNYKGVPQLARELPEWDRRLRDVLGLDSLMTLPRGFARTLAAVRATYDARPPGALAAVARRYGAAYVVTAHRVPEWEPRPGPFNSRDGPSPYPLPEYRERAKGGRGARIEGPGPRLVHDAGGRYFLYHLPPTEGE